MKTISKVPVVHEDIAIGVGKILQARSGTSVEVRQVELSWIFRTTDEVRGLDITKYSRVQIHQPGKTNEYWYDASSIEPDDGGFTLKPDSVDAGATGRWLIVFDTTGSLASVPLSGTIPGFPVTGPIEFENSLGELTYTMQSDVFGPDAFGFITERSGTAFIIATKDDGGTVQGFAFTEDGSITLPSNDGTNQEGWEIGAKTLFGDDDVLLFAPIDALGNTRTHPIAFIVSPSFAFSMSTNGSLVAPRQTVAGDDDAVLTTKAYVESILPPGGGEANTYSSPAASGEAITMAKVGIDLEFKKLIAGTDISFIIAGDSITIDGSGGGGGGLPAGLINQGLRNDAGTNTYVATDGLLIDAAGQVSVGPSAVAPAHPLTINGNAATISGGHYIMNNPVNSAFSELYCDSNNRTKLLGAVGASVDIHGAVTTGPAVNLQANGVAIITVVGASTSHAEINYGASLRYKTISTGTEFRGTLNVQPVGGGTDLLSLDASGDLAIAGDCEALGFGSFASLTTYIGGIDSATQVKIGSPTPLNDDDATRRDYVIAGLAGKSDTNHNHNAVYLLNSTDTLAGTLTVTNGIIGQANLNIQGTISSIGALDSASLTSTSGGIASAAQVKIGSSVPANNDDATRKDYVDTQVATKVAAADNTFFSGANVFSQTIDARSGMTVVANAGFASVFYHSFGAPVAGTITTTVGNTTNYGSSSDVTLKDNINPANESYAISLLDMDLAVEFDWKVDGAHSWGFIAQDMEFLPGVTSKLKGLMYMDQAKLVPYLWAQNQAQQKRLDRLEAMIEALTNG